jgi:TetR/AcrR family transcriptional repressor of mexJK operon
LSAARRVFLELGFVSATMDAIADMAGVSKQTVYNHFGSKEELFASMVRSGCKEILTVLQMGADRGDPEQTLRSMGRRFLEMALQPEKLALRRVLLGEIAQFPELGQIYYRSGPAFLRGQLAEYLEKQDRNGFLVVADPQLMADQFVGMLSVCLMKAELGIKPEMNPDERERYIDHAVGLVMSVTRPGTATLPGKPG